MPKPKQSGETKPLQESQQQNTAEEENDNDHDQDLTEESEIESRKVKEKKHDSGAADLEKVTDYAEETEITSSDLSGVRELIATEMAERLQKEKELQQIKIKKEDVDLIVKEMEISHERAERALREHGGSLMDTLVTLTN